MIPVRRPISAAMLGPQVEPEGAIRALHECNRMSPGDLFDRMVPRQ
jgi:hypothetical protein